MRRGTGIGITSAVILIFFVLIIYEMRRADTFPKHRPAKSPAGVSRTDPPRDPPCGSIPASIPNGVAAPTLKDLLALDSKEFLSRIRSDRRAFEAARDEFFSKPPEAWLVRSLLDRAARDPSSARVAAMFELEETDLQELLALLEHASPTVAEAILSGLRDQPLNLLHAAQRLACMSLDIQTMAAIYPMLQDPTAAARMAHVLVAQYGHESSSKARAEIVRVLADSAEFLRCVLMTDPDPDVRRFAAQVGRLHLRAEDRAWLFSLIDREADGSVRAALEETCALLGGQ